MGSREVQTSRIPWSYKIRVMHCAADHRERLQSRVLLGWRG